MSTLTSNQTLILISWQPGESGLPSYLFQPGCVIEVVQGSPITVNYLSWPYGGQPSGECTLGPLPYMPPSELVECQLVIPGEPSQTVFVAASLSGQEIVFSLTNLTGGSGQFTTQAQAGQPSA